MITGVNVLNENGQEVKIDIIMQFRIEENNKEYVVNLVLVFYDNLRDTISGNR